MKQAGNILIPYKTKIYLIQKMKISLPMQAVHKMLSQLSNMPKEKPLIVV